jgi:two-component system NtrC family sensor kinase
MADRVQASRDKDVAQNRELREALDHLRTTQEELVQHEKLSAMGQMLAGLAHELNNPLAGVLGMAELLRDELTASRDVGVRRLATELALPLASEAKRARDLVRNLLSFARKPSETLEPVALSSAVGIAIGLRSSAYAQAGKSIETNVASSLYVRAETQKLQHVIVNLVNNALDAMTDHGTTLRISAFVDDADRVHLCFDDEGHGFADAHAAFEPFYTTKPTERGTGLGLTLTRKFVQEFGGSVIAENRAEGGARVTIVLRRVPAPEEDVRDTPTHACALAAPTTGISFDDLSPPARSSGERRVRPRVLVVDDEASLRELQRRFLHREGFDVLLACNGEEARQLLSVEDVDLVISDLRMPGKTDGHGLIAWIEEHRSHLADHILVVTGDLIGLPSSTASEISPDRVLSKPFTRDEYVERVRAALDYLSNQPTSAASSGSTG